jgi:hypothetical protein
MLLVKGVNIVVKKIYMLAVAFGLITCLAGCGGGGGGGSSSGGNGDQTVTNSGILTLLDNYRKAVDAYQVDGMLACLDKDSFMLTINEGSYSDSKDYYTLKTELINDQTCQLAWRKTPTQDPNGHNYQLDLRLGTPVSSNETSTGAVVKQTFEVWESSDDINPAIKTDSGNIVWTLVQSSGVWQATAMIINYDTTQSAALVVKDLGAINVAGKGFGFSRVGF